MSEEEDEWVGPKPPSTESVPPAKKKKKIRVLPHEDLYLENLPSAEYYEKSLMHRDVVTHVLVTRTGFFITASADGIVKFWKKESSSLEFVKLFRCHLCPVKLLVANVSGTRLASMGQDSAIKVFDVVNFDMITMIALPYCASTCEFVHSASSPVAAIAVGDTSSPLLRVYDAHGGSPEPIQTLSDIHFDPVVIIKYNSKYDTVISVDSEGIIEYWRDGGGGYTTANIPCLKFSSKLDTDLFEFVKNKKPPLSLCVSPTGQHFATLSTDRKVRVFKFLTGKLALVFDENVEHAVALQQRTPQIPNMDFSRRLAVEREVEKSGDLGGLVFDDSGYLLFYPTLLGVKVVNIHTGRLVRTIGKPENMRTMMLALYQGSSIKHSSTLTLEQQTADNPNLVPDQPDPTLLTTAYKKNRFYMYTRRDASSRPTETDRDIFNEKPSKEDIIAATDKNEGQRLFEFAILHTSYGDIHIRLFLNECPRTVENFCVHAKNGYFNGHIFHRVIKQFMIQTGDPLGTGTGGESIWGTEFADEFHPSLKHDRPYTLSMANAGPDTNGSQFFITLVPTSWLDNKHTVFGRVVKGMDVIKSIGDAKTHPKTDKPHDDITIVSITAK